MATSRRADLDRPEGHDPAQVAADSWQHHRLDGDASRYLALTSLLRLERIVVDNVEPPLRAHGLSLTDYLMLMTLHLSQGTELISRLARTLLVHATTATLAIDRLEGRGLVARSPHPTDRRATLVSITEAGRDLVGEATASLAAGDFGMPGSTPQMAQDLLGALTTVRAATGDTTPPQR